MYGNADKCGLLSAFVRSVKRSYQEYLILTGRQKLAMHASEEKSNNNNNNNNNNVKDETTMILIVRRNEDSEKIRVPDGIPSGTRIFSESSFLLTNNNNNNNNNIFI